MIILVVVVIVVEFLNVFTFVAYYRENEWQLRQPEIRIMKLARAGEVMNYFLPGMMDQPYTNYEFLFAKGNGGCEFTIPELTGGVTMVYFRNTGWGAHSAAIAIRQDAVEHGYKQVRIFSLSVGDQVARELTDCLPRNWDIETENIAINPCSSYAVLNPLCKMLVTVAVPIVRLLDYALGWLSIAPVISPSYKGYSLWLITDQAKQLMHVPEAFETESVLGVILSSRDEFLDNGVIKQHFGEDVSYATIDVKHADTRGHAEEYRKAVQDFLQHSRFQ